MTEVFYAAVKGSLHANDCSVFGLKPEEISALGRRFDSNKPVINGFLIKGTPLDVINSLAELGYRVTCSSGETEIVWTLRREALLSDRPQPQEKISPATSPQATPQATPPLQVSGRPFVVQPSMLRNPVKPVERIGTKPEDWALVEDIREKDRIVTKHISSLEKVEPGQKIILKTNLSSEFNPLSKRPGPIGYPDGPGRDFIGPRKRSHSAPPATRHHHRHRSYRHYPSRKYFSAWNSRISDDGSYWSRSRDSHGQYCYHVEQILSPAIKIERSSQVKSVQRQGLQIYLEDIIAPNISSHDNKTMVLKSTSRELFKHVFLPFGKTPEGSSCAHSVYQDSDKKGSLCSDAVELCTGNSECHDRAHRNTKTDPQQHVILMSTSDVSVPVGSNHHRPVKRGPVGNISATASYLLEDEAHYGTCSDCSHKLDCGRKLSRVDICTKSEPCQQLHSCISNPQDDTHSDYATRTINSLNISAMLNDELSINNDTVDKTLRKYSTRSLEKNDNKQQYPSIPVSSVSAESSYPDLTVSELRHSRGTSAMKTDSSTCTCPHGYKLSELPYVERTYHIVNRRSDILQDPSRHDMNGSPCPSIRHSVSERTHEQYMGHPKPRRIPRCKLTSNEASSLCSSVKQWKKGSHLDDTEPQETRSNSAGTMNIVMEKIGNPNYEELEESDWSLISSLVDDVCRNKRKKRKTTVPPYQARGGPFVAVPVTRQKPYQDETPFPAPVDAPFQQPSQPREPSPSRQQPAMSHQVANPSVVQTLDEMDFERGLWYPAMQGDLTQIDRILAKGVDVNQTDKGGYTPLHYAVRSGDVAVVRKLLQAGANVHMTTKAGHATPLHRAAGAGHLEVVKLLVEHGADKAPVDSDGRTPLHRSAEAGHESTSLYLLRAAPNTVHVRDSKGLSPIQVAKGSLGAIIDAAADSSPPSTQRSGSKSPKSPQSKSPAGSPTGSTRSIKSSRRSRSNSPNNA